MSKAAKQEQRKKSTAVVLECAAATCFALLATGMLYPYFTHTHALLMLYSCFTLLATGMLAQRSTALLV
jgi:hypothetical protein